MSPSMTVGLGVLDDAAFAPFGQVVQAPAGDSDLAGDRFRAWRIDFDADGPVQVMVVHYDEQPLRLNRLERHLAVSQTFISLAGQASVMVVAAPTEGTAGPAPGDVHAFLVPGGGGVLMWPGTWHALSRFPVGPGGGDFVMITGDATQKELECQAAGGAAPTLTEIVDFERDPGTSIEIVDPDGLIASL